MIDPALPNYVLNKALYKWGIGKQFFILIEEMAELTQAIIKSYRHSDNQMTKEIIEEMADVEIMLMQMRLTFTDDMEKEYQFMFESKIRRLHYRVDNEDGGTQ
jgi:NTP pyrophosphatase (non-canonical NTP hydrolase)